jgi:hypothetical protein
MKFLVQMNLIHEMGLAQVRDAIESYPHQYVSVIPFSNEFISEEPITGTDYIAYGSTLFIKLGHELGWQGVYFDYDNFNYETAVKYRSDMLNDDLVLTASEVIPFLEKSTLNTWFIRPALDLKHFNGQVIERQECIEWLQDAMACASSGSYQIGPDLKIVLSRPQYIQAEWRWFIVAGKIVSGAMYRNRGQLVKIREMDESVISEAQRMAGGWLPHRNCVMDTALVDDKLYVVEFNCINGSGFYGHDVSAIFTALAKDYISSN